MNNQITDEEIWKTRRKHLLIWILVEVLFVVGLYVLKMEKGIDLLPEDTNTLLYEMIIALWILVPITVSRSEKGSWISDFATQKWRFGSRRYSGGSSDTYYGDRTYNLNNAGDAMAYGASTAFGIFSIIICIIRLIPNLCVMFACFVKNVICYAIIAVPFPITTFCSYLKSRDKVTAVNMAIPMILLVAVVGVCGTHAYRNWKIEKQEQEQAAEQARLDDLKNQECMNRVNEILEEGGFTDFSFGKSMELKDGEFRAAAKSSDDSNVHLAVRYTGYEDVAEVTPGTVLVCTGREKKVEPAPSYEVYLLEDRSLTAWVYKRNLELPEDMQE